MYKKPVVTWLLLAIQIAVFLLMELMGSSQDINWLVFFGAKVNPLIAGGEYWRLVTPMFIHIGFVHLLFNSITLYYLGAMVEEIAGHAKFLLIYLLAGIMGNLFSYQFSDSISAGASTALFGLFAFFIALTYLYPDNRSLRQLGDQYKGLLIINIFLNLFMSNVDMAGHIGGAVGGILATFMLMAGKSTEHKDKGLLAVAAYVLITAAIIWFRAGTVTGLY